MATTLAMAPANHIAEPLPPRANTSAEVEPTHNPGKTNPEYKSLTAEEVEHFLTKGWLLVPGAIKPEYVDWVNDLYVRIGYDEHDKSTWHSEYLHLPRHHEIPAEEFAPEAWKKTVEICGGLDRIHPFRERYYGDAFIVNFGSEDKVGMDINEYKPEEQKNWHTDSDWYRMFLDSAGDAMTVVHCFSDIPEGGGGTWLCEDGMPGVVKWLYDHPEGIDPPHGAPQVAHVPSCKKFTRITAKKGDVLLMHGLLPHVASPNHLHFARVITNPHVTLLGSHNLNRHDGNYSLLEQVILNGLGRESLPEWEPTRERQFWFPRNAGFKQVYAEQELARLEAHHKKHGLGVVDSIHKKKGTREWDEYIKHNNFDLPLNPAGNLMEQHTLGSVKREVR